MAGVECRYSLGSWRAAPEGYKAIDSMEIAAASLESQAFLGLWAIVSYLARPNHPHCLKKHTKNMLLDS